MFSDLLSVRLACHTKNNGVPPPWKYTVKVRRGSYAPAAIVLYDALRDSLWNL